MSKTKILLIAFLAMILKSGALFSQSPTFTFQCVCDYVTGDTCDICDETLQSRLFKGLIIYRNGTMYKLIDAPYIVSFQDSAATIRELIYPNPETIRIGIEGTNFTTLDQYKDSLKCPCAGATLQYIAGPGISIFNDTIASIPQQIDTFSITSGAQDTLWISLTRDSVPALFVVLPGGGGGQSWTIDADAGDTELISNQTVLFTGAGINTTSYDSGTNTLTITGTEVDGSITNELQTLNNTSDATSHTVTLSNSGGSVQLVEGSGIGLATTGTALDGIVTITNTGDLSDTNEAWTIDGDDADTELITTQTVKFEGAGIITTDYDPALDKLVITGTEVDGSTTNELQTFSNTSDATSHTLTLSNSGGSLQYIEGSGIGLATGGTTLNGTVTITNTGDLSSTNEAWTIDAETGDIEVISNQTVLFDGTGIVSTDYNAASNTLTINATEVDGSTTNEAWTVDADDADTELITTQTVKFEGAGIITTDYDPVNDKVVFTGTEVDGSTTNEAWTIDAETGDIEVISNQTVLFDGTGIVSTDYNAASNTLTINATEVDGSTTNELQTLNNTSDATSHTVTLSNSGGSVQLVEGSGISLATTGTALDGIVTISSTLSDENGIYGEPTPTPTAGSGDGTLPPGGSIATIPGQWQPLSFACAPLSGQIWTALKVTAATNDDERWTKMLIGKTDADSLEIYLFDGTGHIDHNKGLTLSTGGQMYLSADSIHASIAPSNSILSGIYGQSSGGFMHQLVGSSTGQVPTWNNSSLRWELGAGSTGPTGTGTANRFAYWTGTNTLAADDDAYFDGTNIAFGTTTTNGKVTVNAGTSGSGLVAFNAYGTGSNIYSYLSNLTTSGSTWLGLTETASGSTILGGLHRYGSTHATRANEVELFNTASASLVFTVNSSSQSFTYSNVGYLFGMNRLGAGVSSGSSVHSVLQSGGSFATAYLETVGAPTFDATKRTVIYTASVNISWTLPSAATCNCAGREYILHHAGSGGTITLSQTITKGNTGNFNTLTAGQWAYIIYGSSSIRGYKVTSL